MQQDQEKSRQDEYKLLQMHLAQTNVLLDQMVRVNETGSTVAATKKSIPFQTGSQSVGQLNSPPANPDNYPTIVNVYAQNNSRPIQHMTLINDGPGQLFYIVGHSKTDISTKEGQLNVNDQQELFNVWEVRLRSTLPLSTFRLIEGIFRTGSFAQTTKANVEVRPTVVSNEKLKQFSLKCDIHDPTISITPPLIANFILPSTRNPLPPGQTAQAIDTETGIPMPFRIPKGNIIEGFSLDLNFSTDFTLRFYVEIIPNRYTLFEVYPSSSRGMPLNFSINLAFPFTTETLDPNGAPTGGRGLLFTVTNDDPFYNMIGGVDFQTIMRQLS
jgi:hypothetical protein